jgi:hypothetical protein
MRLDVVLPVSLFCLNAMVAAAGSWRGRSRCAIGSGDRMGPRAAGSEGETVIPLDPATWRGHMPPGARE